MTTETNVLTRREFLQRGLWLLAAGYSAPFFLTRTVWAMQHPSAIAAPRCRDRVLVVLQLGGGNDGLNTVVPFERDEYYRVRPTLALKREQLLRISHSLGLHPALTGFRELFEAGQLAVVQGVGYPNPDRSHFRSMDIWHTAQPDAPNPSRGWLGRYLDSTCRGCGADGGQSDPIAGISFGNQLPVALRSARNLSLALEDPERFGWRPPAGLSAQDQKRARRTFEQLNAVVTANASDPHLARLDFLSRVAMNAHVGADRLRLARRQAPRNEEEYPQTRLAQRLRTVAQLISAGVDTRVFYVAQGGYDTHGNQAGMHDRLLRELGDALAVFQHDLVKRGVAERVVTMLFSEFGRRVAENGSAGTDHGAAAPMFICGVAVRGGIYGVHPGMSTEELHRGDLRHHTDFRQVYATLLERWLGASSAPILGGTFTPVPFL